MEAERRCAVVMILTRKGDILTDSEIADLTGVDRRPVNQLRKALTETRGPRQVISRAPRALMASRKVRGIESCPLTSLRLASGSTRTSIWRSSRAPSFPGSGQWQEIVLGCGSKTQPPAMSPTGPSSGSRTTVTTWSRRTAGLPAVLILIRWTIFVGLLRDTY
jgi:hypothetical protein